MGKKENRELSPGAMTAKRFFRNRLAVAGLWIIGLLFVFSFLGGALTPYRQDQVFYRQELQLKEVAALQQNEDYRFLSGAASVDAALQARFILALGKEDRFSLRGNTYTVRQEGPEFYTLYQDDLLLGLAGKDILTAQITDFSFAYAAYKAYNQKAETFFSNGTQYQLTDTGHILVDDREIGYFSRLILQSKDSGDHISRQFRDALQQALETGVNTFTFESQEYSLHYDAAGKFWSVRRQTATRVWDAYASPSAKHPLGTDKNGMDMLTRLMYGGRVSLVIGFVVVLISGALGVLLGGIAGYFGKWVDGLIMRLVDIFYCIPSTPLLIILGAVMDGLRLPSPLRMLYLMLILGLLGWPGIARLVRGQILSLREQEFMTATESSGLSIHRRIFRHLLPNVVPQIIVTCTMSLGSAIITEATLSFLGLGVKFPFASWGNIMNDVANAHVLTSYWFVWIPAGICLVLAVLGFNFIGDGLRDAFDPKMKR